MVVDVSLAVIRDHIDPYLADVNVHPTGQEADFQGKELSSGADIQNASSKVLANKPSIPDALEMFRRLNDQCNREKVEQTILPLKENIRYYEKTESSRPSQAEVSDYRVELTEEGKHSDFVCQGNP